MESKDISLMRRALVAGFIGMVKSCAIDVEWYGKEIAYCHCLDFIAFLLSKPSCVGICTVE